MRNGKETIINPANWCAFILILITFVAGSSIVSGASITIDNHSFENWSGSGGWINSPLLDNWTGSTGGHDEGAQENTETAAGNPENFTVGIDGGRYAFVNANNNYLYQNIGANFIEGNDYILTLGVGRRLDHDLLGIPGGHWQISLNCADNGTTVASLDDTFNQGDGGVFTDQVLNYTANQAAAGRQIQVRLWGISVGTFTQVDFDNIRLDVFGNQPPTVEAGVGRTIYHNVDGDTVTLAGVVNDDGLPQGGTLTTEWSLLNGPAVVSFDPNEFVLNPTAQLSLYGVYQFQLFADDGAATNQDVATVTYEEFECSGYPLGDLDGNCRVDLTDLLIFTELWLRDESW